MQCPYQCRSKCLDILSGFCCQFVVTLFPLVGFLLLQLLVQIFVSYYFPTGLGYYCNPYVRSSHLRPLFTYTTLLGQDKQFGLHDLTLQHTQTLRLVASIDSY